MSAPVVDIVSVASLSAVACLLVIVYLASLRVLPSHASTRTRILFIWHLFDSLIHIFFEGSFLYNCFNVFLPLSAVKLRTGQDPLILTPPGVFFMGQQDRLYGSIYGTSPTALMWQEYAKADKRWGGVRTPPRTSFAQLCSTDADPRRLGRSHRYRIGNLDRLYRRTVGWIHCILACEGPWRHQCCCKEASAKRQACFLDHCACSRRALWRIHDLRA